MVSRCSYSIKGARGGCALSSAGVQHHAPGLDNGFVDGGFVDFIYGRGQDLTVQGGGVECIGGVAVVYTGGLVTVTAFVYVTVGVGGGKGGWG